MGCIVLLVDLELTRCVGYNLVSLHENTAETKVRSITVDNEVVAFVGQCKNRCVAQHMFKGLKGSLLCVSPHKRLVLMGKSGERHIDLGEAFNESSIIAR
ncbi:hypothetical protein HanIR_Chr15g0767971 [Helianthus annuus]|nr:hypothetical protein HanIR_Chr15g0767971 [Helianthus annuus]